MSRILLTGGTGFMGRSFLKKLREDGHEVHALARRDQHTEGVAFHLADICSFKNTQEVIGEIRPEHIIHLAGRIDKSRSLDQFDELFQTNVLGTHNVLRASNGTGVKAFIGIGSFEEYGSAPVPFREDGPIFPKTPYGTTKSMSSLQIAGYDNDALPTCVLRLPIVYGPEMPETSFMGKLRVAARGGAKIPVGDTSVSRDFLAVEDVINGTLLAIKNINQCHGEIINVCSGVETPLEKVIKVAEHISGRPSISERGSFAKRQQEQDSYVGSNKKALEFFGWKPSTTLEEGLRRYFI